MTKIIRLNKCSWLCKYRRKNFRCQFPNSLSHVIPFPTSSIVEKEEFFKRECGLPSMEKFCKVKDTCNREELYKCTTAFVYPRTTTRYV